jgi:hypothetical protein
MSSAAGQARALLQQLAQGRLRTWPGPLLRSSRMLQARSGWWGASQRASCSLSSAADSGKGCDCGSGRHWSWLSAGGFVLTFGCALWGAPHLHLPASQPFPAARRTCSRSCSRATRYLPTATYPRWKAAAAHDRAYKSSSADHCRAGSSAGRRPEQQQRRAASSGPSSSSSCCTLLAAMLAIAAARAAAACCWSPPDTRKRLRRPGGDWGCEACQQ